VLRGRARALPLAALVLLSLGALAFDLTQPWRLPSIADWAEVAGALRARARPGDAVQLWPVWLERARLVIDAAPVLAEEQLDTADYPGVGRLWLLTLPGPFAAIATAEAQLKARGATPEEPARAFGPLRLQPFDLHAPPLAGDLLATGPFPVSWPEWHEVQYVSRRCRMVAIGTPAAPALVKVRGPAGSRLQLRAGIIGERAYDFESTIRVEALAEVPGGEAPLAAVEVSASHDPLPAWQRAEAAVPPGPEERDFTLRISTPGNQRPPLCVALWSTR
jgi:hypothetical protein